MTMGFARGVVLAALLGSSVAALGADPVPASTAAQLAQRFGARERVRDISLSPDGARVAIVGAGANGDGITVVDVAANSSRFLPIGSVSKMLLSSCGWSSPTRLVCRYRGIAPYGGDLISFTRTVALNHDGSGLRYLGRNTDGDSLRISQFDGSIIDWREGDGSVLMTRDFVPEMHTGSALGESRDGLGVELVDTVTGKASLVERPFGTDVSYIADGLGNVRMRSADQTGDRGILTGTTIHSYRLKGSGAWRQFSKSTPDNDVLEPLAVDGTADVAYAARKLNGRLALYRVALDGSMKEELVSSNPEVDVGSVVSIGRHGRVIGATYVTDKRQIDYFDPYYKKLAAGLAKALPAAPIVRFVDASADESKLLIFAGSDVDPGGYYIYNKADRHLDALILARPELDGQPLARMKAVTFKAADGTTIPAYLTLPPGTATKGLPAIVMPHGGPSYRDEWGFDWLVQFYADAGYAVLQPNFRGSSGYGDAFYANNGFHSWQTAVGDVADAGRWLVKEGIADPARLAIVGWSYGGYAALQANVVDPDLFKAVVAIAPVTDLDMIKREAQGFTNARLVARQVGSGSTLSEGSPARHADRFKAPVLLFHGDQDLNVGVEQSRAMDKALRKAGHKSTLVLFPGLDHQLDDAKAREKLLGDSDAFLRGAMGM